MLLREKMLRRDVGTAVAVFTIADLEYRIYHPLPRILNPLCLCTFFCTYDEILEDIYHPNRSVSSLIAHPSHIFHDFSLLDTHIINILVIIYLYYKYTCKKKTLLKRTTLTFRLRHI